MKDLENWNEWLSSPACRPFLEAAARFIFRMAARVSLPPDLLPCRDPRDLPRDERDECFRSVAHDLWLFLRSRPTEWVRRVTASPAFQGNPRLLMLRLGQEFFNHLRDQARTSDQDPKRALYRRVRQVLHDEHSITYRASRDGAFYAMDPEARWPASWERLRDEPYGSWESPLALVSVRDLPQKGALIQLAGFFWVRATERLGRPFFLPVRELVEFMSCHYPGLSMPRTLPLHTGGKRGDGDDDTEWEPPSEGPAPDMVFMESRVPFLAEKLVNSWTRKQRSAFALLQGDGVGLKEAAEKLGYRGPSGVAYLYRSVCDSLRDFCLLWPGLSPPDLSSSLFEAFVLEVVNICKKTL